MRAWLGLGLQQHLSRASSMPQATKKAAPITMYDTGDSGKCEAADTE